MVASPSTAAISSPPAASSAALSDLITPECLRSIRVNSRKRLESRQRRRIARLPSVDSSSTITTSRSG